MSGKSAISLAAADDTLAFGACLGRACRGGDLILLAGELGGGKTTLTRGIARGLGVAEATPITSPTFNIVHEYRGRLELFHFDLYRLSGEDELYEIGFDDYLERNGVTVIEWPDRLGSLVPEEHLSITMEYSPDLVSRLAKLTPHGSTWLKRTAELSREFTP